MFDATSLAEWVWSGSAWALLAPRFIDASVAYDPPSLADGAGVTTTVTATGAALGDFAQASFSFDLQGVTLIAWVSAANAVGVWFQNQGGVAVELASGALRVRVAKV